MHAFKITQAVGKRVPIIVSVPHCGTAFPEDLRSQYRDDLLSDLDDTDWYVDRLYDFAPSLGITMITAVYHRWVIDLNRDPDSKPLYSDGRIITGLCPVTDFRGVNLYKDARDEVSTHEVADRRAKYFVPFHEALKNLIDDTMDTFGKALIWDCHSIRQEVPKILPGKFPDLILGDYEGRSAGSSFTDLATKSLAGNQWSFKNNFLFKGGYITRHYGKPDISQHALQLEMTKVNYMDDAQRNYNVERAERMRAHLLKTFEKLITILAE